MSVQKVEIIVCALIVAVTVIIGGLALRELNDGRVSKVVNQLVSPQNAQAKEVNK